MMTLSVTSTTSVTSWMLHLVAVLVFCIIAGVQGEICPVTNRNGYSGFTDCANGCCGRYPNYYCCSLSTAAVAGIVLGAIVVVCFIIFLCGYCLKKKTHGTRVVRPVHPATTTNTVVFTGSSGRYPMAAHPVQIPQPPPYKRHDTPPPVYSAAAPTNRAHFGHHPGTGMAPNQYAHPNGLQPVYHYGMRPAGVVPADYDTPPPQYSPQGPAVPPSGAPPTAASEPPSRTPQYSYGQNHGWAEPSSTPSSTAAPSTAPSTAADTTTGSAAPRQHRYGQGVGWNESAGTRPTSRNTVTTRILPSRLPPLPND